MAYDSGSDALKQLLTARSYGATISRSPDKIIELVGGSAYYFVEVRFHDGGTYVIEATGKEAIDLYVNVQSTRQAIIARQ